MKSYYEEVIVVDNGSDDGSLEGVEMKEYYKNLSADNKYYSWGYLQGKDELCYEESHLDFFHYICTRFGIKKAKINDDAPEGHNIEFWFDAKKGDPDVGYTEGDFIEIIERKGYRKYIFD